MKLKSLLAVVLVVGVGFVSCKKDNQEATKEEQTEQVVQHQQEGEVVANKTISFDIEGMTCAMGCAAKIEKDLQAMPGVQHATVDFEAKKATVSFDDKRVDAVAIQAKVESIADGIYKVSNVAEVEGVAHNVAAKTDCKKSCSEKKVDCDKACDAKCKEDCKKSCYSKGKEECKKTCSEKKEDCKKSCSEKKTEEKVS